MQAVKWGEYTIGSIFDTDKWVYGKNKQWVTRYDRNKVGRYPVISGVTINNGINYYTEDVPGIDEIFQDSLTISTRGEYSGTVTYHEGKFVLANNILVLYMPKLSKRQKLFIGAAINRLNYGGYNNYPRIETLKKDKIKLPSKNGKIDFDFMESFIAELETQRIAELSAYLKVSGFDNYELSVEELKVLQEYPDLKFVEFDVSDVFNVKNTSNILSCDIIENSGQIPYLCASAENNGVSSYIKYDDKFLEEGNCIFIGGKTFVVSYQENDFYSNDSHNLALYLNNQKARTKLNQMYVATCVFKSLSHKYSWGNSVSKTKIKCDKISLPSKDGKPNFDIMETFISAIQKLVIKDVVEYSDAKINATKTVVTETK